MNLQWLYFFPFLISSPPTWRYLNHLSKGIEFHHARDCFIASLSFVASWFFSYNLLEAMGFLDLTRSILENTSTLLLMYFHYYIFGIVFFFLVIIFGLLNLCFFLKDRFLSKSLKELENHPSHRKFNAFLQKYYLPAGSVNTTILTVALMKRLILAAFIISGIILISPLANAMSNSPASFKLIQTYQSFVQDVGFYKDALIVPIISTAIGSFFSKNDKSKER